MLQIETTKLIHQKTFPIWELTDITEESYYLIPARDRLPGDEDDAIETFPYSSTMDGIGVDLLVIRVKGAAKY